MAAGSSSLGTVRKLYVGGTEYAKLFHADQGFGTALTPMNMEYVCLAQFLD